MLVLSSLFISLPMLISPLMSASPPVLASPQWPVLASPPVLASLLNLVPPLELVCIDHAFYFFFFQSLEFSPDIWFGILLFRLEKNLFSWRHYLLDQNYVWDFLPGEAFMKWVDENFIQCKYTKYGLLVFLGSSRSISAEVGDVILPNYQRNGYISNSESLSLFSPML